MGSSAGWHRKESRDEVIADARVSVVIGWPSLVEKSVIIRNGGGVRTPQILLYYSGCQC